MSEDTQKMPQSRSTALMRHQNKGRRGTNKDNTNATYETTDAQTKKNYNKGTVFVRSEGKLIGGGVRLGMGRGLNKFYSRK